MSFADYLLGFSSAEKAMPLMHSTSTAVGAKIVVSGEIKTRSCEVYGQDLVYLFYGRPAFKPLSGAAASAIDEHLPMCLVIDPNMLGNAIRIVPFDSGGFDRYNAQIGPLLERADFELGPDGEVPLRLVRAFFETNRNYYRQFPTADPDTIPVSEAEARAYARLTRDTSMADDDDRRSTIEIQISGVVPLAYALRAVVAPPVLMADPKVKGVLDALTNVRQISYETYGRQQPSAYAGLLYDHVARFLVAGEFME
jgi:hypothetical protein